MKGIALFALAAFLSAALPALAKISFNLTELQEIPLQEGINKVSHLTSNGTDGTIIKALRENGNAHAYNLFMVLANGSKVVGVEDKKFQDEIRDDPHTFEDYVKSVRFARGKINGSSSVLLLTATRDVDFQKGIPSPTKVTFDVYQLVSKGDLGKTDNYFKLVDEERSKEVYCNSELALSKHFGLPLPDSYEGPNQKDGCSD